MADLKNPVILAVDDTPENLNVIRGALGEKYSVKAAVNGPVALKIAQTQDVDIILLDVMMPEMDGYEVCRRLKNNPKTKSIPVIFVTAKNEDCDEEYGFEIGAVDYISKPVNPTLLKVRIENQLALYDQSRMLQNEVKKRTNELSRTRLEVVERLGRAAEYRDNETGQHVIRVGKYSKTLALAHGLNKDFADVIEHAAPMHDVGKIGISDTILLKPGKLTDEEFTTMKTHAIIGATILDGSDYELMRMANVIAASHHEKWNGSGYPYGLSGEDIPIEGRIVAIADVFDALASKRPYKDPWPVEKIIKVMNEDAGSHFDPALIETFNNILPTFFEILETYKDDE